MKIRTMTGVHGRWLSIRKVGDGAIKNLLIWILQMKAADNINDSVFFAYALSVLNGITDAPVRAGVDDNQTISRSICQSNFVFHVILLVANGHPTPRGREDGFVIRLSNSQIYMAPSGKARHGKPNAFVLSNTNIFIAP